MAEKADTPAEQDMELLSKDLADMTEEEKAKIRKKAEGMMDNLGKQFTELIGQAGKVEAEKKATELGAEAQRKAIFDQLQALDKRLGRIEDLDQRIWGRLK
jgi:predicted ABC-type transport system involved in lysophospholipase L1 biosynthesis ATPase subunit